MVACPSTAKLKLNRFEVCEFFVDLFQKEGDLFLSYIMTTDETWVHHPTSETKQVSTEL